MIRTLMHLLFYSWKVFLIIFLFASCQSNSKNYSDESKFNNEPFKFQNTKQKGAHVFGQLDSINVIPLRKSNYNWITLVPWGDQEAYDSPEVRYFNGDRLELLKRDSSWKSQIDIARSQNLKVFLKPHIWLSSSYKEKWRSDIFPSSDKSWEEWKKSYTDFILYYASIAEENEVELFCIGTELSRLSVEKTEFWKGLIREVRKIYSGKLTYAANWHNEYEKISFWKELDFIGIQAYFPLAKNTNPSLEEISKGWKKHIPSLELISKKYNRKIIFTEMGYKSTSDAAIKPWEWIEYSETNNKQLSMETQANCYQAFFDSVWNKDWLVGMHLWQWRCDFKGHDGRDNLDFTPRGKPAEKVISTAFRTK